MQDYLWLTAWFAMTFDQLHGFLGTTAWFSMADRISVAACTVFK
jgi:hypothetical protein